MSIDYVFIGNKNSFNNTCYKFNFAFYNNMSLISLHLLYTAKKEELEKRERKLSRGNMV